MKQISQDLFDKWWAESVLLFPMKNKSSWSAREVCFAYRRAYVVGKVNEWFAQP